MDIPKLITLVTFTQLALADVVHDERFKFLNDRKDDFFIDEHLNQIVDTPYIDDINEGLGEYGKYNQKGLKYVLNDVNKPRHFDYDVDRTTFAGPGCFAGCEEKSGKVITVIPAKRVETLTYTTESHEGDNQQNY